MYMLLANMKVLPSRQDDVEALLRDLQAIAREEPGNVVYAIHKRHDDPQTFVVYELYRDQVACDAHLEMPQVQDALTEVKKLLVEPPDVVFGKSVSTTGLHADTPPAA